MKNTFFLGRVTVHIDFRSPGFGLLFNVRRPARLYVFFLVLAVEIELGR